VALVPSRATRGFSIGCPCPALIKDECAERHLFSSMLGFLTKLRHPGYSGT
jgi:hypothetical protein